MDSETMTVDEAMGAVRALSELLESPGFGVVTAFLRSRLDEEERGLHSVATDNVRLISMAQARCNLLSEILAFPEAEKRRMVAILRA